MSMLIRLYPRAWRDRYDEPGTFGQQLEQEIPA